MSELTFKPSHKGVWLVYDGDCPLCNKAALALRIKQDYGALHLINARSEAMHPLMFDIQNQHLDLDQGMVIFDGFRLYHGADALQFMAHYADDSGLFNKFNRVLFRSRPIARFLYPMLRAGRDILLRIRGVGKISNLK